LHAEARLGAGLECRLHQTTRIAGLAAEAEALGAERFPRRPRERRRREDTAARVVDAERVVGVAGRAAELAEIGRGLLPRPIDAALGRVAAVADRERARPRRAASRLRRGRT